MAVTEERNYLFVHKVVKKKLSEKTSHAASGELFLNMFSRALRHLKDNKHNGLYLALKIC